MIAPGIVVHGGAGRFEPDRHARATDGCARAARAGLDVLAAGGSALDAVTMAVRLLEDCPEFNAGVGSVLTRAGTVEADASIMDGESLRFGAVAAMPDVRNAIDVARAVMDDGEHVLLCGEGAWQLARERGFAPCDPAALVTERARRRLAEARARRESTGAGDGPGRAVDPGTVGACARDARGHLAAATSTGGTTYKRVGRIGDSPLCGAGTYADDRAGAASATGHGESIIRVVMTRSAADHMRRGLTASEAAWRVVAELGDDVGGEGGVICCDPGGRLGAAHNSENLAHAAGILAGDRRAVRAAMRLAAGTDLMALF